MNLLNIVGVALMALGAAAAFVLSSDASGVVIAPVWRVAIGAFLAANGVVLRYLPPSRDEPVVPHG